MSFVSNFFSSPSMMAIPRSIKRTPTHRLNQPLPSETEVSFAVNFSPKSAIRSNTNERPNVYASKYVVPSKKLAGNTEAKITKYVGEQVENIGPSDAPTITSPQSVFLRCPFPRTLFEPIDSFEIYGICSHKPGNTNVRPNATMIEPERYVQKYCGTVMNTVETFRIKVNAIIESANEPTTI